MRAYTPFDSRVEEERKLIQSLIDLYQYPVLVCSKDENKLVAFNKIAVDQLDHLPQIDTQLTDLFPDVNYQLTNNSKISTSLPNDEELIFLEIKQFFDTYILIKLLKESIFKAPKEQIFFLDDLISITNYINTYEKFIDSDEFWLQIEKFLDVDSILIYLEDIEFKQKLFKISSNVESSPPAEIEKEDAIYFETPMLWKKNHLNYANIATNFYTILGDSYPLIYNYSIKGFGLLFFVGKDLSKTIEKEKIELVGNLISYSLKKQASLPENTIEKSVLLFSKNIYIVLDERNRITDINHTALKFLGYKRKNQVINKKFFDLLALSSNALQEKLVFSKDTKRKVTIENIRIHLRDGGVLPIEITVIPFFNQLDQFTNFILLIDDLSAMEELKRQSIEMEQKAEIGNSIQIFSHEVKNTLNNMTQLTNELLYYDELKEFHPQINKIKKYNTNLSNLMNQILYTSKIRTYDKKQLDLIELIKNEVDTFKDKLTTNKIKKIEYYPETCPMIFADETAMHEVFTNLIQNAIDAMLQYHNPHRNLTITVKFDNINKKIFIDVADTGVGIPDKLKDKIFKQYHTTKPHGNGIGLYFTEKIVNDHDGEISFSSIPGATVFHVMLPVY